MQTPWHSRVSIVASRFAAVVLACALLIPGAARAVPVTPERTAAACERVAEEASLRSGVPLSVLKAIAYSESGRKVGRDVRPWPWTVNMEGAGHWFDTFAEARAFVEKEFRRGARSFDVGCFQINFKWHGEAFGSIDEMFDPMANALYAARFLAELYAEKGSWNAAAGAYHSRSPEFATPYAQRFASVRQRFMTGQGESDVGQPLTAMAAYDGGAYDDIPEIPDIVTAMYGTESAPPKPRVNNYPLLQRSAEIRPPSGVASGASLLASPKGPEPPMPEDGAEAAPTRLGGVQIGRIATIPAGSAAGNGSLLGEGFFGPRGKILIAPETTEFPADAPPTEIK